MKILNGESSTKGFKFIKPDKPVSFLSQGSTDPWNQSFQLLTLYLSIGYKELLLSDLDENVFQRFIHSIQQNVS